MSLGDWITASMLLIQIPAAAAYAWQQEWGKFWYFVGAIIITASILKVKG